MSGSAARVRELVAYAIAAGASVSGPDGQGHYVAKHPNGELVRIACTPGDLRGDDNCKAEIRRKFGYNPPRPNAGKYRKGVRREKYRAAETRVDSVSAQYDQLVRDHKEVSARVVYLLSANDDGPDLMDALSQLDVVEAECVAMGRRPPLRGFRLL